MVDFFSWTFVVQVCIAVASAQLTSNATCADLDPYIAFNASITRQMPALAINGTRRPVDLISDPSGFSVINDTSRSWSLKLGVFESQGIRSADNQKYYQQRLLLDTAGSNLTDMGTCHSIVQAERRQDGFYWSKSVLERSLNDNGDCTTMLGAECIAALKQWYSMEAAKAMLLGNCSKMNNTVPTACKMPPGDIRSMNFSRDASSLANPRVNESIRLDPSLECGGVNVSRSHAFIATDSMSYDAAVRFPLVDIMTFWPNRTSKTVYSTSWAQDVHVEVVCMRPDRVAQGSQTPPSAQDVLNAQGVKFPESGAVTLEFGVLGWLSAAIMGAMLVL